MVAKIALRDRQAPQGRREVQGLGRFGQEEPPCGTPIGIVMQEVLRRAGLQAPTPVPPIAWQAVILPDETPCGI